MKQSAMKQYAVIAGLVAVLALISFLLFHYGRQHKVVIDNRTVETADGQSFRALPGARVGVDVASLDQGETTPPQAPPLLSFRFRPRPDQSVGQAVEMMPRERIMVKVVGPSFNLKADVFNNFGETTKSLDVKIDLGARRDAMVRLVKLANDLPDHLEEFPNDSRPAAASEEAAPPSGGEGAAGEAPALGDM